MEAFAALSCFVVRGTSATTVVGLEGFGAGNFHSKDERHSGHVRSIDRRERDPFLKRRLESSIFLIDSAKYCDQIVAKKTELANRCKTTCCTGCKGKAVTV